MTKEILFLASIALLSACSHYGGGTTGTGLNFRENMKGSSAVSGCESENSTPSFAAPITISGKVRDEKGRSLKGLEVVFDTVSDSQSTILDAAGQFNLVLTASSSGLLTVSVPARGEKCTVDYPLSNVNAGVLNLRLSIKKDGTLAVLSK